MPKMNIPVSEKVAKNMAELLSQKAELVRDIDLQIQKYLEGVIDQHELAIDGVSYSYNPKTKTLDQQDAHD